jgi:hypothetical protein
MPIILFKKQNSAFSEHISPSSFDFLTFYDLKSSTSRTTAVSFSLLTQKRVLHLITKSIVGNYVNFRQHMAQTTILYIFFYKCPVTRSNRTKIAPIAIFLRRKSPKLPWLVLVSTTRRPGNRFYSNDAIVNRHSCWRYYLCKIVFHFRIRPKERLHHLDKLNDA